MKNNMNSLTGYKVAKDVSVLKDPASFQEFDFFPVKSRGLKLLGKSCTVSR